MKLTEEIKQKIITEYALWVDRQYQNNTEEQRDELGQFFTPPSLTIEMLEKIDDSKKPLSEMVIMDPTIGAGGLIAAAIIAGADPKKCYGNEYDENILQGCKERLIPMGVPEENLHLGNALDARCLKRESFTRNFRLPQKQTLW